MFDTRDHVAERTWKWLPGLFVSPLCASLCHLILESLMQITLIHNFTAGPKIGICFDYIIPLVISIVGNLFNKQKKHRHRSCGSISCWMRCTRAGKHFVFFLCVLLMLSVCECVDIYSFVRFISIETYVLPVRLAVDTESVVYVDSHFSDSCHSRQGLNRTQKSPIIHFCAIDTYPLFTPHFSNMRTVLSPSTIGTC